MRGTSDRANAGGRRRGVVEAAEEVVVRCGAVGGACREDCSSSAAMQIAGDGDEGCDEKEQATEEVVWCVQMGIQ